MGCHVVYKLLIRDAVKQPTGERNFTAVLHAFLGLDNAEVRLG